jgi:YbbR domain-containing protein
MIKKITNRLGWKIVSVIAAFFLWLLVVNYDDPIITRPPFNNVTVVKLNASAITTQNKAIEYLEGETVDVTVRGKRSIVNRLSTSDIRAYVDLSKVSITGAIDIEIDVPDGIQIVKKSPGDMKIALENIISVQKEVQYYFDGEPSESYVALDPVITPSIIQITGPESQVNLVSSVVVPINIKGVNKDITLFATPQALDKDKKVVSTITTNVDRVQVSVPIIKKKVVPIIFEQVDDVAPGYRLTEVKISVNDVSIMGKEEVLKGIDSIIINSIYLAGQTEDITVQVSLEELLEPNEITILNEEKIATITLIIDKLEEKKISVDADDISMKNIPKGYRATISSSTPITLTVKGTKSDLNKVSIVSLNPYISLNGLVEGINDVKLNFTLSTNVQMVTAPSSIKVDMIKEE